MSYLKKIESTFKEFAKKNDFKSFGDYIYSLEEDVICKYISYKIRHSDAPQVLNYIYKGLPNSSKLQAKRFKITQKVLQELQSQKLNNMQANAIISRVALEIEKLTPAHLVQLCEYCVNCIQQENEDQTSWKDLLPKLLNVIETCDEVNHAGVDLTGSEYKSEVIRSLLMVQWPTSIATSLASMFTDIPLTTEQHLQIVNKLCSSLEKMDPPEVPPLVHQLLQLCKNQHGVALFLRLQVYFSKHLYSRLGSKNSDSERTAFEIGNSQSECEAQYAEATVLFHIRQSANFGHASIKNFLKYMKSVTPAPELVFDPFLLTILLSLSTISIYEEQVFDILKCTMQRFVNEEELTETSAWLNSVTPDNRKLDLVFTKLMENNLRERTSVMEGLVNLAFVMLGLTGSKGKEKGIKRLWELGTFILVRLIKKHHETTGTVLQTLTNCIITGQTVTQYTNCLHEMAKTVPLVLNDHKATMINLLELLTQLHGPKAEDVVQAVLPTVRAFSSLRDVLIMVLRKSLFSRNVGTRMMAVTGFLQLLKHLDVKGLAVLNSQSSQRSSSQSSGIGHTMLTQIDLEAGSAGSNNEAICLELLGVLRRVFMQQAEVKVRLYEGLHSGVVRNPELSVYVQDMIFGHFCQYYESDADTLPPIKFSNAVVLKDTSVELKEPLGHLIFCMQQLVTTSTSDRDSSRLVGALESLCNRMVKCSLEDFGLNETTNLLDAQPESQLQAEIVRQILGVYEALLGYVISSCNKSNSTEKVQTLISVFKGYSKISEYVKNNAKGGKKADADADGFARPKKVDGDKKGRGKPITFKWPHPVFDHGAVCKMLSLMYSNSLSWCTTEASNAVKGRRELSRFVMEVTLKLVKSSEAEKCRFMRTVDLLNHCINIGSLLYKHCVTNLQEFKESDCATAVLALECFNELLVLISSNSKDRLGSFLGQIGDVPMRDGLEKQLLAMVSKYQEFATEILSQEHDGDEEPVAKRIPLLVLQGLTYLVQQIPSTESSGEVLQWVKKLAREKVLPNLNFTKSIISLLFSLEMRCKPTSALYRQIAMQLCDLVGIIDDGEPVEKYISFASIRHGYENTILSALCDSVKRILEQIDWILVRLRGEYVAIQHAFADDLHSKRERLKSKEQDVVGEVSLCIYILNYVSSIALVPGPMSDTVLKLLSHQYITLKMLTKYFTLRTTKTNVAFQTARFESAVKLAGKHLSPHVYNLISHIEASQKNEKDSKKKKADPQFLKSKVLRETRCIPKLVFDVEQFEKCIIELSRKSKVNLMNYVKMSTYRDFRIESKNLQQALDQDQSITDDGENADEPEVEDNVSNDAEPPKKKKRKE